MRIQVLGAAAGGGYPQWNCNHPNSRKARNGQAQARTQSSIAVSADGTHWFLCNASPDLRRQIELTPALQPPADGALRYSPIQGAVLTNADVDHVAGLLNLRESQPLGLYGTQRVLDVLAANSIFNVLNPKFVRRVPMQLESPLALQLADGTPAGLEVVPFAVPGKVALWLEDPAKGKNLGTEAGDTIALEVRADSGERFYYVPGCAELTAALAERLRGAPLVFFDGTLWQDDEMIRDGVGVKTGARMGHLSLSGPNGTLQAFAGLEVARKILIHINTTNPVLLEDSPERQEVEQAGWEVSYDGMVIELMP